MVYKAAQQRSRHSRRHYHWRLLHQDWYVATPFTVEQWLTSTTDFYVELKAYGDFTKLNLQASDFGGELDPHGATGEGNPVGGNVTSNAVTGDDVNFEEWMVRRSQLQR